MAKTNEIQEEVKQSYGSNSFSTKIENNVVVFDSAKDLFRFNDPIDVAGITVNGQPLIPGGNDIPGHYSLDDYALSVGDDNAINGSITVGIGNQIEVPDEGPYGSVFVGHGNSMSLHTGSNLVLGSGNESEDIGEEIIIGNQNIIGDLSFYSVFIGNTMNIQDTSTDAVVVGDRCFNDGKQSVVLGANARNYGDASVAIGFEAQAHDNNAIAIGPKAIAEEGEIALSFGIDGTTYTANQIRLKLENGALKITFDGQTWGTVQVQF